MVMVPKVMGSNPSAVYWMYMTFFTLICCKNCIVCLKRLKIKEKDAGVSPFKKIRILLKVGGSEISTIWLKKIESQDCRKIYSIFLIRALSELA